MAHSGASPLPAAVVVAPPRSPTDRPHVLPPTARLTRRAVISLGSLRSPEAGPVFVLASARLIYLVIYPETPYFPDRRIAMPQSVSSVEASKSFGRISRQALAAPLTITHHGHDSLVLMSAAEYQRLKSRDREVLALGDFTEQDRAAIAGSRAPAEAAEFDGELRHS
ncbi:MAG: hypothetical protein B7Y97_13585 [Sphingomonas sp. 32-66-10]|nr:MAG: hypothetical protein B7Y97_13585 [Sphingomonas sp. 32-66-10]